ncbi:MAG: dTDP-glucose 4,6-dehydratase [Acetivibrionales bacterium]|jgi:dTDP-glucose 4,6-dehydratase
MKTLLVTGGAGFIGSNFIMYMLDKHSDYRIINIDVLTYAGNPDNLRSVEGNPNYEFIRADIADKNAVESVFRSSDIDYVVNFAAESHVDRSILSPEVFIKTNIFGTLNLLNISKNHWFRNGKFPECKKFIQISTDEVYGSLSDTGYFSEETPLDPHSPYSASKAGADLIVKSFFDTYKMPINITRCSNNYGPYQFPEKLIPLVIANALRKKDIPVYGDGLNVRDWLYVSDHCRAIEMVMQSGRVGEVYNIGGHNEKTNLSIIKYIISYLHDNVDSTITPELIKFVEDRKGHDRRYAVDYTKISNELGWHPATSFEEGLRLTIEWYLDNSQWIENIYSGEYHRCYKTV